MEQTLPKISIVTPSLNQAKFIEQTILSVLNQDYPDLEYFVIDGGSTDGTLEILRKFEGELSWISEPDNGQSNAINKGLRMATGQVLAYLNSDDMYLPGALQKVGEFFIKNPEASWLTGKCRIINIDGVEIRRFITIYKNFWLLTRNYQVLLMLDFISQPATFWQRKVLEMVGFFDEELQYAMDYEYSLRVGKQFDLYFLNEYLSAFRIHPSSKAGSSANAQFESDLRIVRNFSPSRFQLLLHTLHNKLVINFYRHFLGVN
ncbi:MAG: glycosyltransferase [Chloroflexota bacterium]|nr:MAG: glycosyltransferase [Chloroflexota bacterium]